MSAVGTYVQGVIREAQRAAQEDGSSSIEAEHLLLAVAANEEPTSRRLLTDAGLDRERIREALDREFDRSLGAVGVPAAAFDLRRTLDPRRRPRIGTSAKLAIARGFGSAPRKRDLRPAHLLLGILQARVGTVPRALELAGIEPDALRERVRASVAV